MRAIVLRCYFVSANWFSELGHAPALGRLFVERIDDRPDAAPVVVVSHEFWHSRLAGDSSVVGRAVRVNDRPATIVGVAQQGVADLDLRDPKLWLLQEIDHFIPGEGLRSTIPAMAAARPADYGRDETLEPALPRGFAAVLRYIKGRLSAR